MKTTIKTLAALIFVLSLSYCTKQEIDPTYCWKCIQTVPYNDTILVTDRYVECDKTEEQIKEIEKDRIYVIISNHPEYIYYTTKCNKTIINN